MSEAQKVNEPTVCCVMLTRDRPEMAARAVRCFKKQTYERKKLLVFDTGEPHLKGSVFQNTGFALQRGPIRHCLSDERRASIGHLRNIAAGLAVEFMGAEIICHFDDDDYSHPYRIAEQVNLLMTSKKQAVGYRDMLFWRTCKTCDAGRANCLPKCPACGLRYDPSRETPVGETWLFTHPHPSYCLGTSLCYWRKVWERKPFKDLPKTPGGISEDSEWLLGVDSFGIESCVDNPKNPLLPQPRMIATIHGGNTSQQYEHFEAPSWKRVPEWDDVVRRTLEEA